MKWPSARSSRARAPRSSTKRAPDIFAAVAKSISPSASPREWCSWALFIRLGSPWRRISTLSDSSAPSGTPVIGGVGQAAEQHLQRLGGDALFLLEDRHALLDLGDLVDQRLGPSAALFLDAADLLGRLIAAALQLLQLGLRLAAGSHPASGWRRPAAPGRAAPWPGSKASGASRIARISCMSRLPAAIRAYPMCSGTVVIGPATGQIQCPIGLQDGVWPQDRRGDTEAQRTPTGSL